MPPELEGGGVAGIITALGNIALGFFKALNPPKTNGIAGVAGNGQVIFKRPDGSFAVAGPSYTGQSVPSITTAANQNSGLLLLAAGAVILILILK